MNSIEIIFEHIYFLHQKMKSFNTEIYNKSISFSFYDNQLKLVVFSEEDYDSLLCFCLELDSMMYLYLGSFPEIKSIQYNGEIKDITNLAKRFSTDKKFNRTTMALCDITSETINEENYLLFKGKILWTPFYSMQYIVSSKYEPILPVHRLTLMTHIVEASIQINQEDRGSVKTELQKKYNLDNKVKLTKYFVQISVVLESFIKADTLYKADILSLMGCNEYSFWEIVTDTRNWYSHMWKENEGDRTKKLKSGDEMAIYFEILYCAVRLYLTQKILKVDIKNDYIKEYLYVLHDWIVKVNSLEKNFKSNTYKNNESVKLLKKKLQEIKIETKEEVMEWMLDIQLGRRNLSPIQRIAVAEKYRPIYEKQAKENQSLGGGDKKSENYKKTVTENLPQAKRNPTTSEKLADIAGVSEKTYRMGSKILNSDNEELKNEVLSGEKSINAGYKELQDEKNEESSFTGPYRKSLINWEKLDFQCFKKDDFIMIQSVAYLPIKEIEGSFGC